MRAPCGRRESTKRAARTPTDSTRTRDDEGGARGGASSNTRPRHKTALPLESREAPPGDGERRDGDARTIGSTRDGRWRAARQLLPAGRDVANARGPRRGRSPRSATCILHPSGATTTIAPLQRTARRRRIDRQRYDEDATAGALPSKNGTRRAASVGSQCLRPGGERRRGEQWRGCGRACAGRATPS